jgi:hypothetical protein
MTDHPGTGPAREAKNPVLAPADAAQMQHEKIKLLLEIYEQDRKQTMLFVSFCFLLPGLTLAQAKAVDIVHTNTPTRLILLLSLALFIGAGLLLLRYVRWQNWIRLGAKEAIFELDPEKVKEILMGHKGLYARYWRLYENGVKLLWIAAVVYLIFIVSYFFPNISLR